MGLDRYPAHQREKSEPFLSVLTQFIKPAVSVQTLLSQIDAEHEVVEVMRWFLVHGLFEVRRTP